MDLEFSLWDFFFNYKYNLFIKKKERWRKICHANTNQKKGGVAVLTSDKADFRARKVVRDQEGHYVMIKEPIFQEAITILIHMHLITQCQNT